MLPERTFDMAMLTLLLTLCTGPATPATAYLDCTPQVGDYAYCPDVQGPEEADCVVTYVVKLESGHSIVRWERAQ